MINDIVLGKKARIDECVRRIRTYMDGCSDRNSIDDRIRIDAETINDVIEHRLDDVVAFTVRFFSVQP